MNALRRSLTNRLYVFLSELVRIGDAWLYSADDLPSPWVRALWVALGGYLADVGWLIRDAFRLPVYRARGAGGVVVFAGRASERLEVERLLFPNEKL